MRRNVASKLSLPDYASGGGVYGVAYASGGASWNAASNAHAAVEDRFRLMLLQQ
jgi:hypothetical protein